MHAYTFARYIRATSTPSSDSLGRRRAYRIIIYRARGAYNGGGDGKFIIIIVLFYSRSRSPSVASKPAHVVAQSRIRVRAHNIITSHNIFLHRQRLQPPHTLYKASVLSDDFRLVTIIRRQSL
uniref:Uncharacterized protein n=1 Tax=Schizaphis graminum TaxID=13262 RepID=A0A2S2NV84_SCHGA